MANPNIQPIFSHAADIQGGQLLITASTGDYWGQNVNVQTIAQADAENGGFFQRLRFKPTGTVSATVARIYLNNGGGITVSQANVPQNLTGTGGSGGTLLTSNITAKVAAVDQWGVPTAFGTESANIAVTGPTGSVTLNWNASSNSNTYILVIGKLPNAQEKYVKVVGANTYNLSTLSTLTKTVDAYFSSNTQLYNNFLYGELSLPAVTGSATAATPEIDYPLNIALPNNWCILCGLATAPNVSNGWIVTAFGGKY